MELRHLRYFVAVAEAENVSRAALKLHVSQPALSRQVRDLEDELGLRLLERGAKSVRLTGAGRVFLQESLAVLQRAEQAVKAARAAAAGKRGELEVGYAPTLTVRLLPPLLRMYQSAMPEVRVKLHDLSTEEMLAGLREGKVNVALTVRPAVGALRGLRFEELTREPLRLAVAPMHPLARRRAVSLNDAAREPFIAYSRKDYPDYHELLRTVFARAAGQPHVAEEHDGVSSLISAVETGNGVALVPLALACSAGSRLKLLPITPAPHPLIIGAIFNLGAMSPAAVEFLKLARETALKL